MQAAIKNSDVDDVVLSMDLTECSEEQIMQKSLRELLWNLRKMFNGLGQIKNVQ